MFSNSYKTTKILLSFAFVFSMVFSPFYSISIAFAEGETNEGGVAEETQVVAPVTETPVVSPIIETTTEIESAEPELVATPEASETEEEAKIEDQNSTDEDVKLESTEKTSENGDEALLQEVVVEEEPETTDAPQTVSSVMSLRSMSADASSVSPVVYQHTCALPDSLGDSKVEPVVQGWDPLSLQDVFNNLSINKNVISDQKQHQAWNASGATTSITVQFKNRITLLDHVFGYYRNGDISTFVPVFRSGNVAGFSAVPEFSAGQSVTLDITGSGSVEFAIKTSNGNVYSTRNSLNENGNDHAVVYETGNNTYIISFEDLPLDISDIDYNDITVGVTVVGCQNTPVNLYCPTGDYMSYEKFIEAQNAGLISFGLDATNTPYYLSNLHITNKTGCNVPITFESYKVFGGQTVPQQFLDRSEVMATSTSILQVRLADCMSQVDWFYGTRSMQSDSDPTTVFAFLMGFLVNATQKPAAFGGWNSLPAGGYCPVPPANTPPTISIIGDNPLNLTVGDIFADPGATATDLEDGDATTTAHIIVTGTVNASTTGSYLLTYSVTDSGGLSASTTRTVVVSEKSTPPPVNPPTDSGGGGGGGIGGHRHEVVTGEILGATTCSYLRDYLKIDWQNDKIEVLKLQSFLNVFEKENLSLTGVYDQATFEAVERFQTKYSGDVLEPWGEKVTTGFVYILTKKKVNEIYCNITIDLNQTDKNEIEIFRNTISNTPGASTEGYNVGSSGSSNSDLANKSENTESSVVELKDNSKTQSIVRNAAVSLFALPQKWFDNNSSCKTSSLLLVLVLIALLTIIYKLFTGSKNNKGEIDTPVQTPETENPIILPGALSDDEEIIIENPEEGPEEEPIVTIPDFRDNDQNPSTDKQETN